MTGVLAQISRSKGGMPKLAVAGPVMLGHGGIEGDWQNNRKYHGGPEKAVLMVSSEILHSLEASGFPVAYGSIGENLTVTGLDPHNWRAGQQYRIGEDAVIELTTLRVPCSNLHVYGAPIKAELYDARCKAGDVTSPHWAHGGFYARVVRPGLVMAGAPVTLLSDVA
jgi:MOSC domain-containing protein YiiM